MRAFRILPKAIGQRKQENIALPAEAPRARPAPNPSRVTLAEVEPYLQTFLNAPVVSDPASREAEANIKRIADACGVYLTASFIHSYVESLSPTKNDEKRKKRRPRGFELAGELYYHHLHAEVNSIEGKNGSLGPMVFRSYCNELFDCFLAGEHVRKGVGYPIMLMEALLNKAATTPDKKSLYLTLADQAIHSMEELSRRKFKKDAEEALRAAREERKEDAPAPETQNSPKTENSPETKSSHQVIDHELFDYLQRLQKGYAVVRDGFEKTMMPETTPDPAAEVRSHVAYLQELLNATARGRYLGLTAMMKEILGRTLHRARQEKYGRYVLAAAQDLERLADKEQELYLIVMSAHRYRKARELYSFAGDREKAEAASCKLAKLKSEYDPQMPSLSRL